MHDRFEYVLSERHVQAIWYDAALRPGDLRTSGGAKVRVVDPGRWNLEAGPDFRDAVLEIGTDRRRVRGDVEIHVHAADWTSHGHIGDPEYANVVAHVLGKFDPASRQIADAAVAAAAKAVVAVVGSGVEQAMNLFNSFDASP